jgi:hypothetical protein
MEGDAFHRNFVAKLVYRFWVQTSASPYPKKALSPTGLLAKC